MRTLLALLALGLALRASDFPEWRGPLRNGVLPDSPPLLGALPKEGLKELWESEKIPSNDDGGLASPVVSQGKVYLSLVWHRDEPSATRQISDLVVRQLGWQNPKSLGAELVAKIEKTRLELPPTLRGGKLDEFAQKFVEENLDKKQRQLFAGFVINRFKKGKLAMPLEVLETLEKNQERIFASEEEMKAWLDSQGWEDGVKAQIVQAVPPTRRVAEDTVVCLDAATGKTLWKTSLPGQPVGRNASSTPVIAGGRIHAVGSGRAWALDTTTGKLLWEHPLKVKRGIGSSPLVVDGLLVLSTDHLLALDAATGAERWKQEKAGGSNSSPTVWKSNGRTLIISNSRSDLHAIDPATGAIVWTAPGGGDSTPVISGATLVMHSRKPQPGLVCYALESTGATLRWSFPIDGLRTQSSPIIHEGAVYYMEDNNHYCFDLANGSQRWVAPAQSTIASPVLTDGKLFAMANNGNTVVAIKAEPTAYTELGRATVRAQWVPSPCIADGRLLLRTKDSVKAWSLLP